MTKMNMVLHTDVAPERTKKNTRNAALRDKPKKKKAGNPKKESGPRICLMLLSPSPGYGHQKAPE
jgi:hypothetical protein